MSCSRCGGEMVARTVPFCVCDASPPILIENVPAQVCLRCGGEVFSDSTIEVFERIRDNQVPISRIALMIAYDFNQARQLTRTNGGWERVVFAQGTSGGLLTSIVGDTYAANAPALQRDVQLAATYAPYQPATRN